MNFKVSFVSQIWSPKIKTGQQNITNDVSLDCYKKKLYKCFFRLDQTFNLFSFKSVPFLGPLICVNSHSIFNYTFFQIQIRFIVET